MGIPLAVKQPAAGGVSPVLPVAQPVRAVQHLPTRARAILR
ncbi:hypothetical protein [Arthrobacter agilis]|nr:hypothetical protein [Arthrobacter agilis]MDQ0735974.1 hypothetical protein [Arthrobacter agilis]